MSCCFCSRSKRAWGSSQKFKPLSGSLPEILCPGAQASWLCSVFAGSKRSTVQGSQRSGFGLFGPVVVVDLGLQFWKVQSGRTEVKGKPLNVQALVRRARLCENQPPPRVALHATGCGPYNSANPLRFQSQATAGGKRYKTLQNAAKTAIQQQT